MVYNYIYINNIDTNKYIYIYQNNSYYLITRVYPSQVRYGDINIELTFNEDAYKYKNTMQQFEIIQQIVIIMPLNRMF